MVLLQPPILVLLGFIASANAGKTTPAPTNAPVPKVCAAAFNDGTTRRCFRSFAGQTIYSGTVCVDIINGETDMVQLTYDTSDTKACLLEVQAYVGDTIPVGSTGNPNVGLFPMKAYPTGSCVKRVVVSSELVPDCQEGGEFTNRIYKLAAHATNSGLTKDDETSWTAGVDITVGGSWATFTELGLTCKCSAPVPVVAIAPPTTKAPTKKPTKVPTKKPTTAPTKAPTKKPTKAPTKVPTKSPTKAPTKKPTKAPTKTPTKKPSAGPTKKPTTKPTKAPTTKPTKAPTMAPTKVPTKKPTKKPSAAPTKTPTKAPSSSPVSVSFATPSSDCTVSFADKSTTKCYETVAGQYIPAGKVCLEVVNGAKETVKITYDTRGTAACLQEVQAYFGDNIPGSNPGAYPEKAAMGSGCVQTYTVTTDLIPDCNNANLFVNRGYKLAAHSSVQYTDGNGGQTAWTRGKPIDGGSWAMYSDVFLSCQCGGVQQITVEKPLTALPTKQPSKTPTKKPTTAPTKSPTKSPTKQPTKTPTKAPTKQPTKVPTKQPTKVPTKQPTSKPTVQPTTTPTSSPTEKPTAPPTGSPSETPTSVPSSLPTGTLKIEVVEEPPTGVPTFAPTFAKTFEPIPGCPRPAPENIIQFTKDEL